MRRRVSAYTFVATEAGLWRNIDDADTATGDPLVSAPVQASRRMDAEQHSVTIVQPRQGWCVIDGWHDGTFPLELTKTLCVRDGAGIVGGGLVDPRPDGFVLGFGDNP